MSLLDTPTGYVDRFNPSNNWVKVLFKPGRFLQSGELIEMQSIMQNQLKQGFDSLYRNGSVVRGLKVSVLSQTDTEITLVISEGLIYIDGVVLSIPSDTITVPTVGVYNIGVLAEPDVVDEIDDFSLRDPNTGGARYGTEGAHRLVLNVSYVLNSDKAVNVARVSNGALYQKQRNPFEKIEDLLANYIYDKSGNFCVKGLSITQIPLEYNPVSDNSKFRDLSNSFDQVESDYLNTLSRTNETKEQYDLSFRQLNEAQAAYNVSPTPDNLFNLNFLKDQTDRLDSFYKEQLKVLQTKQAQFQQLSVEIAKAESTLVSKVRFSIEPGVAYVLGKRVELSSASYVDIVKDLDQETVDSAVFTYSGSVASTRKTFSLASGLTVTDLVNNGVVLTLSFQKLIYLQQLTDVTVTIDLSQLTVTTLSSLLDFVVYELSKPSTEEVNSAVTFTSNETDTTQISLRSILKSNVFVSRISADTLQFEATSLSIDANQIEITATSTIDDVPTNQLVVDLPVATLTGAYRSSSFQLGFRPVKDIINLVADLEENQRPIVRGPVSGTSDLLGDDTVFKLVVVSQGDTVYRENIDYTLINQSEILWLNNDQPQPGTTYFVTYIYTQPLSKNVDYVLNTTDDSIVFIGKTPARNYTFRVTYTYYLAKEGIIYLQSDGNVGYVISNSAKNPVSPKPSDNVLSLAKFRFYQDSVELINYDCKAFKLEELRDLIQLTRNNVLNLDKLKLSNYAFLTAYRDAQQEPVGVVSNNYVDTDGLNYADPQNDFSFSFVSNAITTSYTHTDVLLQYVSGGVPETNVGNLIYFLHLDSEPFLLLEQQKSSSSVAISTVYRDKVKGHMYLSNRHLFRNKSVTSVIPCDSIVSSTSISLRDTVSNSFIKESNNLVRDQLMSVAEQVVSNTVNGLPTVLSYENTSSLLSLASVQPKCDQVELYITVEDLIPNSGGYRVYIAGVRVDFEPKNGTSYQSPNQQSPVMSAKADGTLECTVSIVDLPIGAHTVEVIGYNGYAKSSVYVYNNLLNQVVFTAARQFNLPLNLGLKTEEMLPVLKSDAPIYQITLNNDLLNPGAIPAVVSTVTDPYTDLLEPIHQSFSVPVYCHLSQVKVKFKSVSNTKTVKLLVREVIDDLPQRVIYGIGRLTDVNVTQDASEWSTFELDFPVLLSPLNTYCFSLLPEDDNFELFVSKVNEADLNTGDLIADQFYLSGDLYLSTDGIRLEKQFDLDLTYQLIVNRYVDESVIVDLGTYDQLDFFNSFCVNCRNVEPLETDIRFEYRLPGNNWIEFQPNLVICLESAATAVDIRAHLSTVNEFVSPYLMIQGASVSLYSSNSEGAIVSKTDQYEAFTNAVVYVTLMDDAELDYSVFYSIEPDTAGNWVSMELDTDYLRVIDPGLNIKELRFVLSAPLNLEEQYFTYKIEFSSNSNNKQPIVVNSYYFVW